MKRLRMLLVFQWSIFFFLLPFYPLIFVTLDLKLSTLIDSTCTWQLPFLILHHSFVKFLFSSQVNCVIVKQFNSCINYRLWDIYCQCERFKIFSHPYQSSFFLFGLELYWNSFKIPLIKLKIFTSAFTLQS